MSKTRWELVSNDDSEEQPSQKQSAAQQIQTGAQQQGQPRWELDTQEPNDPNETFGQALSNAPGKMYEDLANNLNKAYNALPGYLDKAKTEIPGFVETYRHHPVHLLGQQMAGLAELGKGVFNAPHDIANYSSERLNLVPQNINEKIQMGRMPEDTQGKIDQWYGQPKYPGEAMARGGVRNAESLLPIGQLARTLNPLRYTNTNVMRNIIAQGDRQIGIHNNMFNQLWRDADRAGINRVNYDHNLVNTNRDFIQRYTTPRQYESLNDFIHDPTLANAQVAQSDLGSRIRALDEQARTKPLTGEERNLYDALTNTQEHIQDRMFRDAHGTLNEPLMARYRGINNSYRENVVPYRYNPHIQAFRNQEMLAKEAVQKLQGGEFAARRGRQHPELYRNDLLKKSLVPLMTGLTGATGAYSMYKYLTGKAPAAHE